MNRLLAPPNFGSFYRVLVRDILNRGITEENARTGAKIMVLVHPTSFVLDLSDGKLPVPGVRKVYPRTAAAEVAWFLSGLRTTSWIRKFTRIWEKFTEGPDEKVLSAYGYRWRHQFGRDQVSLAIHTLQKDPSDRQVLVSAWDPRCDGLGHVQKSTPCPTHFALSIVAGRLNMALFIRSSDVFVGLPYDVMGHALLLRAFAASLCVPLGHLHVTLAHPHIYGAHWDMAVEALKTSLQFDEATCGMPRDYWTIGAIEDDPNGYVKAVDICSSGVVWPSFNPRPELIL